MIPADAALRERAVDPLRCVCVSAPAGSGKTELLIQRFLALLARVDMPERVVAITFTRKAAAEMRARLLAALRAAERQAAVAGTHEARTRDLAVGALAADTRGDWQLLATPTRLRIQTIDSLCGELTRQMPILSGVGGEIQVADDTDALYEQAISDFLARADAPDAPARFRDDLAAVLLHLDNNWGTAASLLRRLLQRRDQWQQQLLTGDLRELEGEFLVSLLDALWTQSTGALETRLGVDVEELRALFEYRAQRRVEATAYPSSPRDRDGWIGLSEALLTGKGDWRRSIDVRQGFPVGDDAQRAMKARMLDTIARLRDGDADARLRDALLALRELPRVETDPRHWQVLQALLRLLPELSAQLLLTFRHAGAVDHAQVALGALHALGDDDEPTDLAMSVDRRIDHLLVDEFQDTSSSQFELLRRLTRRWAEHNAMQPQAPRTLMLVGDAMQSIYGFREANVGLFLRAREEGVGDLALEPLELSVNFRSSEAIIDWVNRQFRQAFPAADDAQLGAVQYRPSRAARSGGRSPEFALFRAEAGREDEVDWLCDLLEEGSGRADVRSIGVLGRSRPALAPLLARMRERGIAYAGRDLDALEDRMVVQDLLTLCSVLADPWDRFAWLSLLRAPWAALDNRDLLLASRDLPVAACMNNGKSAGERCPELSAVAVERIDAVAAVLRWAERYRDRLALRVWVESCWLFLGGAAAAADDDALNDAERFFQLLEALEQRAAGLDLDALREALTALYAAGSAADSSIEVMTLHKSKGLEFDWVLLPALDRRPPRGDDELLLWDELLLPGYSPAFLLDVRSASDARDRQRIFDYLRTRRARKRKLETTRLLYVGCTRAAQRLVLSATVPQDDEHAETQAAAESLLGTLWPDLAPSAVTPRSLRQATLRAASPSYRRLRTLPATPSAHATARAAPLDLDSLRAPRIYGTALHRVLEALLTRESLPERSDPSMRRLMRAALRELSCEASMIDALVERAAAALDRTLADDWARWMLSPKRAERRAEMPVTALLDGRQQQLILDYSFLDVARGERWVIDYKTAAPEVDEALSVFLTRQCTRHGDQLQRYREALGAVYPEPVRCALYFPALGMHCETPVPGTA